MDFFSIPHLLIILVVVVLIFGTKKLPSIGKDLGDAMRGFKKGLQGEDTPPADPKKLDSNADDSKNDKSSGS